MCVCVGGESASFVMLWLWRDLGVPPIQRCVWGGGGEGREEVLNPARGLDGISSSEFVDVDLIH